MTHATVIMVERAPDDLGVATVDVVRGRMRPVGAGPEVERAPG